MKLKSIGAVLFGLLLTFSSCEQNEVNPTAEPAAQSVDLVLLATANASNDSSTTTTTTGKKCGLTEVAVSELPAAITSYITTNYAGSSVVSAGTTNTGNYTVHVKKADSTSVGLVFDANGNFVSEKSHNKVRGTEVAVTSLSVAITDYIAANYAGSTLVKAMQDNDGNFIVAITKADATVAGLVFDTNGTFVSEVTMQGRSGGKSKGKGRR